MPKYDYVALDNRGKETKGTVEVASQNEAIGRVKEMGLFPTKIVETEKVQEKKSSPKRTRSAARAGGKKGGALNINININIPGLGGRVKPKVLTDVHAAIGDAGGRGSAAPARTARARKAGTQRRAQKNSRRTGAGD